MNNMLLEMKSLSRTVVLKWLYKQNENVKKIKKQQQILKSIRQYMKWIK